ncbi:aldo/keto reductase [Ensifer canadensis]|uniref:aldo/keto reductase n=1 Tax=Ensifer canadensis TaxID=555315 RepID=UPI0035E3F0EE
MSMDHYYLLGRSGLRVSRLALGTMTFGNGGIRGIGGSWGSDEDAARAIFNRYLEIGGNFIDTADSYAAGVSEELIGKFVAEAGIRDRVVISTKFSNNVEPGNPNAGGNGRKNLMRAVDASLRRLKTDYIDLYLLHTWDRITPAEEVMRTFDDLVRAGKIRYAGLSDVPGWYAARAHTWAEAHALTPPICLQLPYSLAERSIENEFVPLAQTLGLGITAWSPLAMGLLSGKYRAGQQAAGRLSLDASGSGLGLFTERNRRIVAALEAVAGEVGRSMAQIALNWVVTQPGVGAAIIGASRIEQLDDNLAALDFSIPAELRQQLQAASAVDPVYPYSLFADDYQAGILNAGVAVGDKPRGYYSETFLPRVTDYVFGQSKSKS